MHLITLKYSTATSSSFVLVPSSFDAAQLASATGAFTIVFDVQIRFDFSHIEWIYFSTSMCKYSIENQSMCQLPKAKNLKIDVVVVKCSLGDSKRSSSRISCSNKSYLGVQIH